MFIEKETIRILTYEATVSPWDKCDQMFENQPLSAIYRNGCGKSEYK